MKRTTKSEWDWNYTAPITIKINKLTKKHNLTIEYEETTFHQTTNTDTYSFSLFSWEDKLHIFKVRYGSKKRLSDKEYDVLVEKKFQEKLSKI